MGTLVSLGLNHLIGRMCWESYKLLRGLKTFPHLQLALGLGSLENFLELFEYSNLFNCKCHAFNRKKSYFRTEVLEKEIQRKCLKFPAKGAMYFWDLDTL